MLLTEMLNAVCSGCDDPDIRGPAARHQAIRRWGALARIGADTEVYTAACFSSLHGKSPSRCISVKYGSLLALWMAQLADPAAAALRT